MPATTKRRSTRSSQNGRNGGDPRKRVLTRSQVEQIRAAEAAVTAAKRRLEKASEERELVRSRYRDRLPANTPIEAGGCLIKRIVKSTGQRFRLGDYLKQHRLTAAMRPFVSKPGTSEQWQVKPLA